MFPVPIKLFMLDFVNICTKIDRLCDHANIRFWLIVFSVKQVYITKMYVAYPYTNLFICIIMLIPLT